MTAPGFKRSTPAAEAGFALLFALFALVLLSGIIATLLMRTISETKVNASYLDIAQSHYSALAGLEEARGRLALSAPDAIPASSYPTTAGEVLYIVNSTPEDPVVPNDPLSPYFDREYLREFPAGGAATLIASDQPNAQTSYAIPYKWVRITIKTEYSSQQDVNQDGVLDAATPLVFNGSQQQLASAGAGGIVYKVTALAVQPTGTQRLLQYEVAGSTWHSITPTVALAAGGSGDLEGKVLVSGLNNCGGENVYGIVSAGSVTRSRGAKVLGQPDPYLANSIAPSPTPAELVLQHTPFAIPISEADPLNISYDEGSATYRGTWVVLGDLTAFPPTSAEPAVPAIVHADHSLSLDAGEGAGILLVEGDLQITGRFRYYGLIVVTGAVNIQATRESSVHIYGAIIQGGSFTARSKGRDKEERSVSLTVIYDSCAFSLAADNLPKAILAFKELAP